MRAFTCGSCREQLVFFENTSCLHCGAPLGYLPHTRRIVALRTPGGARLVPIGSDGPVGPGDAARLDDAAQLDELVGTDQAGGAIGAYYVRCGNADIAGCNWLVREEGGSGTGRLCESCMLTRTRPNDADAAGMAAFAKAEAAKRRLLFQLGDLGLPVCPRSDDPLHGLAFDLLSSRYGKVITGHECGVITLDLAEGDDAYRERTRNELGEPYRTLLGHVRHEIGHYFWDRLVSGTPRLDGFRALFGDERSDYGQAIERHYGVGAPSGWEQRYVSAYATMHPFEDWAETFAHWLHVHDTLQTAGAVGMVIVGPRDVATGYRDSNLSAVPDENALGSGGFSEVVAEWLPLTYALNAVNRSMGRDDLYPFVLPAAVIEKLAFVHDVIRAATASDRGHVGARATAGR